MLLYDRNIIGSSSKIYGDLRKLFANIWNCISGLPTTSEILRKQSKRCHWYVYIINKNNNTWLLVNIEYLFSCSTLYRTRSLHSLVGYRVEYLKRYMYSISTCAHVLSSMYVSQVWVQWYPVSGHGKHLTWTLKAVCLCCFCFVHACL